MRSLLAPEPENCICETRAARQTALFLVHDPVRHEVMELESPGNLMTPDVYARSAVHESNGAPNGSSHIVQFYEDETFLAGAVADFLAGGLATGQPCVVVATEPHRKAIARRLKSKGLVIDGPGAT